MEKRIAQTRILCTKQFQQPLYSLNASFPHEFLTWFCDSVFPLILILILTLVDNFWDLTPRVLSFAPTATPLYSSSLSFIHPPPFAFGTLLRILLISGTFHTHSPYLPYPIPSTMPRITVTPLDFPTLALTYVCTPRLASPYSFSFSVVRVLIYLSTSSHLPTAPAHFNLHPRHYLGLEQLSDNK